MMAQDSRARVIITGVTPEIECGRFPIKRIVGQIVEVEADIFADGHDALAAVLSYRHSSQSDWVHIPMQPLINDHWKGSFEVRSLGSYFYTLSAWIDHFKSWQSDLAKRIEAGEEDIQVNFLTGALLISEAARRATGQDRQILQSWAETLRSGETPMSVKTTLSMGPEVSNLMDKYPDNAFKTVFAKELEITVDPEKALFSSWYEMFPRSCSPEAGRHGTFRDCESRLSYIADMGFDVLYLPPIHPVGHSNRKGKNNSLAAGPEDPGTPWAIGSEEGGHKAVNPQLGTLEEFRHFVNTASEYGLDVALDIAFQCSPDHPYVKAHPEWFIHRPDGTVQYAENPPKKYQDIYPLNFESEDWENLWQELKSIIVFWIEQGIRIFRVDNPHTKSFYFWEWLIKDIKKSHPEVIFLAEAFTRPKVMYQLARLGFSQSYTYFAWRNTKWELSQYFKELTDSDLCEYFRPNLWPNTPDILTEYLQTGGRPAFMSRLVLAATLGASYGVYGPAFELGESIPKELGSEEYLDSEKYEIKHWDTGRTDSLADFIGRINMIRRDNPALHDNSNLLFHEIDNDRLICFSKHSADLANLILVIVNLDPYYTQSGWLDLPADTLGLDSTQPYQVHDLLSGARYLWHGPRNYVELNPQIVPAHVFRVRRRIRTERDFDYFL